MAVATTQPLQADDAFLEDVARAAAMRFDDHDRCDVWWLGQSGFLVGWRDRHLLLDPYLSDSLTRKYGDADTRHARLTARVVDPARLGFVDVVTGSHGHWDHLDPDTLAPLLAATTEAMLVTPASERASAAERAGVQTVRVVGLDDGHTIELSGFVVTAVPAAHEEIERDAAGRLLHLGYVIRFGPFTLYHAGDTVPYAGMPERIRAAAGPDGLDLALLPINGRAPERGVAGNLHADEAAALARDAGARLAVPCHFGMFAFNSAPPEPFAAACAALGQDCAVLATGERLTLRPAPRTEARPG